MGNTYTQIHIQSVFTVQNRVCIIRKAWKDELYKYITSIIQSNGHKVLAINGMPDHIHAFIGLRPSISVSDLARDVKNNSSNFINDRNWVKGKFSWQSGFGAFSYSRSQIEKVYNYILNQENHHKKKTFKEEYLELLKKFEIEYNEKYLFEWIE